MAGEIVRVLVGGTEISDLKTTGYGILELGLGRKRQPNREVRYALLSGAFSAVEVIGGLPPREGFIRGIVRGSSRSDLKAKMDALESLFNTSNQTLTIQYASGVTQTFNNTNFTTPEWNLARINNDIAEYRVSWRSFDASA